MNRIVDHRGCRIAYSVEGSGPAVLLIQGVGVHGAGWRPQIDALASRFTCIAFDNRGMGKSQPTGAAVTVPQMADDAKAILDAERIDAAHVVGHSMGGLIAQQLALDAPGRVRSLALLCTFASGKAAAPLSLRMFWYGLRSRVGTRRMRRRGFLGLVLPPGAKVDEETANRFATLFGHDLADQPPIVNEQFRALRATDLTPRLGTLTGVRSLVVNATHDPIAPPRSGRALHAALPGSRYVEVPNASHGLPATHAERVNELLLEHLAAIERV